MLSSLSSTEIRDLAELHMSTLFLIWRRRNEEGGENSSMRLLRHSFQGEDAKFF